MVPCSRRLPQETDALWFDSDGKILPIYGVDTNSQIMVLRAEMLDRLETRKQELRDIFVDQQRLLLGVIAS